MKKMRPAQSTREEREDLTRRRSEVVENYLGVPIGPDLRERLQRYFDRHPELQREKTLATLIEMALSAVEAEELVAQREAEFLGDETPAARRAGRRWCLLSAVATKK